jgi:hypothetical protein
MSLPGQSQRVLELESARKEGRKEWREGGREGERVRRGKAGNRGNGLKVSPQASRASW